MSLFKNLIFVYCLFFVNGSTFSQTDYKTYHFLLNKNYYVKNSDSIISLYESAFKVAIPFPEDLFTLAFNYYKSGKENRIEKSNYYLYEAVKMGFQLIPDKNRVKKVNEEITYGHVSHLNDTLQPFNKFVKMFIENEYDSLRNFYLSKCKNDYYFEKLLENELYAQTIRQYGGGIISNYILNKNIFCPNSMFFLKLLENDSLPKRRESRRFNDHSIVMLCMHTISGLKSEKDAKRFIDLLWKLVEKGEITPREYESTYEHYIAFFETRHKSYFGTTIIYRNNKRYTLKLIDSKNVDVRREKYWLPKLNFYCYDYNIALPKNYEISPVTN